MSRILVESPAGTLQRRRGVCQDHSQLARTLGSLRIHASALSLSAALMHGALRSSGKLALQTAKRH
jgi:hypothetical protein